MDQNFEEEDEVIYDKTSLLRRSAPQPKARRPGTRGQQSQLWRVLSLTLLFTSLGVSLAIPGPTITCFEHLTHSADPLVSCLFAGRAGGILVASLLTHLLLDIVPADCLTVVGLLLLSVANFLIPWSERVWWLVGSFALQGATIGLTLSAALALTRSYFGRRHSPYRHTFLFALAVGCALTPILVMPFQLSPGDVAPPHQTVLNSSRVRLPREAEPNAPTIPTESSGASLPPLLDSRDSPFGSNSFLPSPAAVLPPSTDPASPTPQSPISAIKNAPRKNVTGTEMQEKTEKKTQKEIENITHSDAKSEIGNEKEAKREDGSKTEAKLGKESEDESRTKMRYENEAKNESRISPGAASEAISSKKPPTETVTEYPASSNTAPAAPAISSSTPPSSPLSSSSRSATSSSFIPITPSSPSIELTSPPSEVITSPEEVAVTQSSTISSTPTTTTPTTTPTSSPTSHTPIIPPSPTPSTTTPTISTYTVWRPTEEHHKRRRPLPPAPAWPSTPRPPRRRPSLDDRYHRILHEISDLRPVQRIFVALGVLSLITFALCLHLCCVCRRQEPPPRGPTPSAAVATESPRLFGRRRLSSADLTFLGALLALFFAACGLEVTLGNWLYPWARAHLHWGPLPCLLLTATFWAGLALGRLPLLAAGRCRPGVTGVLLFLHLALALAGCLLLLLLYHRPPGLWGGAALCGFGLGPFRGAMAAWLEALFAAGELRWLSVLTLVASGAGEAILPVASAFASAANSPALFACATAVSALGPLLFGLVAAMARLRPLGGRTASLQIHAPLLDEEEEELSPRGPLDSDPEDGSFALRKLRNGAAGTAGAAAAAATPPGPSAAAPAAPLLSLEAEEEDELGLH